MDESNPKKSVSSRVNHEVHDYLEQHKDAIQCSIGLNGLPFGTAQCPALDDYADQVDTMKWLSKLS